MQRTNYPKGFDEKRTVLEFKKKTHLSVPEDYYRLDWAGLHELRSSVQKACEKILSYAEAEKRDLTEDESRAFDFGVEVIDAINEEFELREKAGTKEPLFTGGPRDIVKRAPELGGYGKSLETEKMLIPGKAKTYRSLFGNEGEPLNKADFRSLDDFILPIINRTKDSRLEKRAFVSNSGPAGGYAVPEYWAGQIFDQALEGEIVRPRAAVYPMQSDTLHVPAWDNTDHQTDGLGGFSIAYLGENSDATVQTGKLRSMTLTAKKIGIYTEISREAAADGISLQSQLQTKLVSAVSFLLDRDFLTGNGVSKPLGVLNAPAAITVNRATANQVSYADLYGMFSRLAPASQANAVWVINHGVLPQLMNLTVNNNLVFQPVQMFGVSGPVPMTLFGKPIYFTEKNPALGSKGDVMLCDFSQYSIGMRQEAIVDVSNAPGWTRDVISLRVIVRVDGQPLWSEPMTPLTGGNTLSPFVLLDTP